MHSWHLCAVVQLCLVGCGNDLGYDRPIGTEVDAGDDQPVPQGALPCDVQAFLTDHCQGCHGATPINGAPMSLVTYGDVVGKNDSGVMIAQRALIRMKGPGPQMPPLPAPAVAPLDLAPFEEWVKAGTPPGECVVVPGPFDGPSVCSSGVTWTRGDHGSPTMHPGRACLTCHAHEDDAPRLKIGGTVYPTGHEPNDCYGATPAAAASVEVTDVNGTVTTLAVNASGNFLTTQAIAFPIRVAVVANGKRRSMNGSPPVGDCNSCHTENGANGAPGRITLP